MSNMETNKNTLTSILAAFSKTRDSYMIENGGKWGTSDEVKRAEIVSAWAAPVANKILHTGYFQIEDKYRIYPTVLELYYHEESDNGLEDPIMYHTNARCPKYLGTYPYFTPGSFHLHTSGIDITFEKEGEYRASFLIREFSVADASGKTIVENDDKSTHLFDYMFPYGVSEESLSNITWENIPESEPIPENEMFDKEHSDSRKNVYKYEKGDDGRYIMCHVKSTGNWYFKKIERRDVNGKKKYEPCRRLWQFRK